MIRRFEKLLIAIGLLDASRDEWERTGAVWIFGSVAIGIVVLAAVIVDDLLFDRLFNPFLRPIGLLVLLSFFAGAGYWAISVRRNDPRAQGKLDWRAWVALLILAGVALAQVFNYVAANN